MILLFTIANYDQYCYVDVIFIHVMYIIVSLYKYFFQWSVMVIIVIVASNTLYMTCILSGGHENKHRAVYLVFISWAPDKVVSWLKV